MPSSRNTSSRNAQRARATVSMSSLMGEVRRDALDGATPEQLDRMRAAERSREVYRAWNAVCGGTREGEHVTGLRYLPDDNKLLVYLDNASWAQEFTMLREIIRGRMERAGVRLDGFVFRVSKPGFKRKGAPGAATPSAPGSTASSSLPRSQVRPSPAPCPLSSEEEQSLDAAVAAIDDERLRKAVKKAMASSLEWKKGSSAQNKA